MLAWDGSSMRQFDAEAILAGATARSNANTPLARSALPRAGELLSDHQIPFNSDSSLQMTTQISVFCRFLRWEDYHLSSLVKFRAWIGLVLGA